MLSRTRFYQAAMLLTLAVYLYYLVYRAQHTINPEALAFSLLFYYAEVHGFVALALYFFQLWNPIQRTPPPPPPGLRVDVFVVTYNEDLNLVRKTALASVNMRYPHKTYILDDGDRPEFAALAAELGCVYVARRNRAHAKAGNLNHTLEMADGDFVAVFDADYVPQPDFLVRTLGYFTDPKVAFVQTPHNYYNMDSFSFRLKLQKREKWSEQDVFYRLMMPGRDYWNSAFFAGTSAVIRRAALEEIGGFAVETLTEDLQTTIRIYKRGWKGVYHNELLSNGLAAKDLKSYHVQKLRWAEGNISLIFAENPLWTRGLSVPQRICFFGTVFGWFIGLPKLIYFATPAVMLVTGWYPIYPFDWPFVWRYLVFLAMVLLGFKIGSRGHGRIRYDETYNMMNFFVLIKAVAKNLVRWRSPFVVTAKGAPQPVTLAGILPQLTLVLLCAAGVEWGLLKWVYGVSRDWIGIGVGMFWTLLNGYLACAVVAAVTTLHHRRRDFRFLGGVPVEYATGGAEATEGLGLAADLTEDGMALVTFSPLPIGERIQVTVHLGPRLVAGDGVVLYMSRGDATESVFRYGVRFAALTREQRDAITEFCFTRLLPVFFRRFEARRPLLMRWLVAYYDWRRIRRAAKRVVICVPALLRTRPPLYVVTEDISAGGAAFVAHGPLPVGEQADLVLFTPFGRLEARVEVRNRREVAAERSYVVGARFLELSEPGRGILAMLARARGARSVA